jgi:hypothetical protein
MPESIVDPQGPGPVGGQNANCNRRHLPATDRLSIEGIAEREPGYEARTIAEILLEFCSYTDGE